VLTEKRRIRMTQAASILEVEHVVGLLSGSVGDVALFSAQHPA
jgi:hypothetical protein